MWYCHTCCRWVNVRENHFHNYTGCGPVYYYYAPYRAPIIYSVPPINDDVLKRIEKIEKTLENMKKA